MSRLLLTWMLSLLFAGPVCAVDNETLTTFDYSGLELRKVESHWHLMAGETLVKDLGTSDADAREALAVIHELKLSQRGVIGTRTPVLEYWLADKAAPRGLIRSERLQTIDRATLRIESVEGQWILRDARQVWFNFGCFEADARQALAVFQRYPFNRIGYVGFPTPVLIYLVEATDTQTTAPSKLPAANSPITAVQLCQVRQLTPVSPLTFNAATGEERESLDWRRAELRREGSSWKLRLGSEVLADFGSRETEAREALRIVQHYRFTERCLIGASATPFAFYLVNGQPPRGLAFGLSNTSFAPESLAVRQIEGKWLICDGQRPIIRGGDSEADAKQVLKAIQRYRFDNCCEIGGSDQAGLRFLVRER
jgi:hypothetical protein